MAWPNIDARRTAVRAILASVGVVSAADKRRLAAEYSCSIGAIYADLVTFARSQGTPWASASLRRLIRERDCGVCQYCGGAVGELIVEHVVPAILGGPAKPSNLVLACASCNVRKGSAVWVPHNLLAITAEDEPWRALILAAVGTSSPAVAELVRRGLRRR